MDQPTIVRDIDRGSEAAEFALLIASEKIAKGSKLNLPLPVGQMTALSGIPELVDQCGRTARDHGFWDAHVNSALSILGMDRDEYATLKAIWWGNPDDSQFPPDREAYRSIMKLEKAELLGDPTIFLALILTEGAEAIEAARTKNWINASGVWEELADTFIRLFDFIARYGPSHAMTAKRFLAMIQGKMAVNEARPPLHGKGF